MFSPLYFEVKTKSVCKHIIKTRMAAMTILVSTIIYLIIT